ncbi:MAG: SWIM zinc finger family protein [Haliscomenobacter sp.]|nr:SWIM zinc finger family protein [Haliscomenobacter sp.]MBK9487431.1 SWIM zinc finger family protein [Haliscomenobacter sp.]
MGVPFYLAEMEDTFSTDVLMAGEDLWLDGALVGLEEYRYRWTAKVYAGRIEQVSLKLRGDEVIAISCTCPVKGLCAHLAALVMAVQERVEESAE